MIFRGHLLEDSKLIEENKIEDKNVVHLIARMEGANQQTNILNENRQTNESNIYTFFRRAPFFGPLIAFRDLSSSRITNERESIPPSENGIFGRSSLRIISSTYSNIGRNIELAPQPTINSDEIRETIAQNLLEVQNMIDYGNYNEFNEENEVDKNNLNNNKEKNYEEDFKMNCFDLNKRILAKGQWVDVKDTVDQWLDAQVIEVSDDNKMAKIHYNHWSTRWDEWINTNSPRIMPFRYHTRQSTLTNYHSPFPNKKPDMGVTLLSFENLNRNSCVHPLSLNQQRNRNSSIGETSTNQNNNINNHSPPPPSPSSNTVSINTNGINSNNNTYIDSTNSNSSNSINIGRRANHSRYAVPLPPIPSPKHQEPDPENHIIKNLGEDGFLGIFKEFYQINKVIEGLSSELLLKHSSNTEILTPKKLTEIQNKSYYNLKRLIPILDRTGRIYSDISTFMEHSMKTNQLELLSKNIFSDVQRINEDLKFFSPEERRRITQEILSHNSRREMRSGTLNFVPPVNKFEAKLENSLPIIDTPYLVGRNDSPQILDFFINNNNDDEAGSLGEDNNNNNGNDLRNSASNSNQNSNNFIRNNAIENFNIEFEGLKESKINGKKLKNNKKYKKFKNGRKILGMKTKRKQSNNKDSDQDKEKYSKKMK